MATSSRHPRERHNAWCNNPRRVSLFGDRATEMDPRLWTTTILWIHAGAGAVWVGACACFAIAGLALTPGSVEQRNFAAGAAPKIDRLALLAAGVLFATGLINLYIAGLWRLYPFTAGFITVLAIKVGLFIAMVSVMHWTMRIGVAIKA